MKKILAFAVVLLISSRCGQVNQGGNSGCSPNVIDTGLTMVVTQLGTNTYQFALCLQSSPANAVYTVYGSSDQTSLEAAQINTQTAWRQAQITGTNSAGSVFQVTFRSSDNFFAIYQDASNGSGGFTFSTSNSMVRPRSLPNR